MPAPEFTAIGNRYDLEGPPIRSGSRGTVYKARDRNTGSLVAVRVLSKENSSDVNPTARIGDRPGIARFLDSGVDPVAGNYQVTEWLEGGSLSKLLDEQRRLDWQDVADLGLQVASAFRGLDGTGIRFHGDLRPENIMRTRDALKYKITDFLAVGRFPIDSPYTAPEVSTRGGDIDERLDQYSLGVILHEALSGVPPRPGLPIAEALATAAPDAPSTLIAVIDRLLQHEPEARYPKWLDAVAALQAQSPTDVAVGGREPRRGLGLIVGMAVLFIVTVAAFLWFAANGPQDEIHMNNVRKDAANMQAQQFAAGLWGQAENFANANDYEERTRLYQAARDAAWQSRTSNVADAAQRAADFDATEEDTYRSATAARLQAERLYASNQFAEAVRALTLAEQGFRTAAWTRQQRWSDKIRQTVDAELGKIPAGATAPDIERLRTERRDLETRLTEAEVNPGQLRQLQQVADDLRTRIVNMAGGIAASEATRKAAADTIARADQLQHTAQAWLVVAPAGRAAYEHGTQTLTAAKAELSNDTKRAAALAEDAAKSLRSVGDSAHEELRGARSAATAARDLANRRGAAQKAGPQYNTGESAWRAAEQAGDDPKEYRTRRSNYEKAKHAFDDAVRLAAKQEDSGANGGRELPLATPTRFIPMPALTTEQPAAAVHPAPTHNTDGAPSVSSADLGRLVQSWMGTRCDELNHKATSHAGAKMRCEALTILDRRDSEQVKVSFMLTEGRASASGTEWQTPETRTNVLDCHSSTCRCVSGPDCE